MKKIIENIAKLIDFKSIITLVMTVYMGFILSGFWSPNDGNKDEFWKAYWLMIAFYFTKEAAKAVRSNASKQEETVTEEAYTGTLEEVADE